MEKKQDRDRQLQEEEQTLKSGKVTSGPSKVTRDDIRLRMEKEQAEKERAKAMEAKEKDATHLEGELEENVNRLNLDEGGARNVDEAIEVLKANDDGVDKHPERRMKAAYAAFEQERLPQLKQEYQNMRLSQIKQMLRKEWMKHPNNPMNPMNKDIVRS